MLNAMYLCAVVCALWWGGARAQSVTVVQQTLLYDEVYTLSLNSSVEFLLDFNPVSMVPADIPSVVWLRSDGGATSHPVLVTSRQRTGAVTWQLPYEMEGRTLFELERTLCPDDIAAAPDSNNTECSKELRAFSLHVSTSCASATLSVRVALPPVWRLVKDQPIAFSATKSAPRVLHYRFAGAESSVRLVVSSDTVTCATLSVQNYTCPIKQTNEEVVFGLRLTMMRSGAMQIPRSQYPLGFYIVLIVLQSDAACDTAAEPEPDWLWSAALWGSAPHLHAQQQRLKEFTVTIQPSLSRTQYAVAAGATLALFLSFYAAAGALVLAQRWPPFAKYVAPKAVLAKPDSGLSEAQVTTTTVDGATTLSPSNRRRQSNDTYDMSDDSDTDEEATDVSEVRNNTSQHDASRNNTTQQDTPRNGAAPITDTSQDNAVQGPFGLPARLRLAALARRRGRTLRARSDRYLSMLYTVAVFYSLPVIQFVIAFQVAMNFTGSLDICYYNFLCAHPAGALGDFNHVFSNLGYLLLGALFMLQVRRRRARRRKQPRDEDYGIPAHYGLLSALGAGMMVVAVLSASYHVCPNALNFQFDTAFMYVLAVLSMVKIYQARHPDVNARAHATFGVLAVIIALVVWGVLGQGPLFWGIFTVLHIFTFLLLSLRIYYLGQFRLEKQYLAAAASELRRDARPLYGARLVLLLIANALNWLFAIYGLLKQGADFASHILQVLLGNTLMYMVFYLAMKVVHGERVRWYSWAMLAGAAATWAPALYFFVSGSTDWSSTPAESRHRNHECKVLEFYDSHDLWHMLSAVALYLSFNTMLTWDDGLSAVKRTEIAVF
ncbi:unnamed protein product [Colias eurytheme]|nr:unnamed protein product [Colias eurytheme]